jgi:nucleolin
LNLNQKNQKKRKKSKHQSKKTATKPVATTKPAVATKKPVAKVESESEEEESEEVKPKAKAPVKKTTPAATNGKKPVAKVESESEEEESEEEVKPKAKAPVKTPAATNGKKPVAKVESESEEEEEDDEEEVAKPQQKTTTTTQSTTPAEVDTEQHSEIFVRNLSYNTTEEGLRNFFSKYGNIDSHKLLTHRDTGKSKGIGFVEFNTRAEAKKCIADAANLNLDGRLVTVSFSNEDRPVQGAGQGGAGGAGGFGGNRAGDSSGKTVFVGNISFNATEDSLKEFFSQAGNVVAVRIAKTPDGQLKGFCHVEFDSTEAVNSAVALAGSEIDGRAIRVDPAKSSTGGGDRGGRGGFGGGRGGFGGGRGGFGGGRGGFGGDRGGRGGRGGFGGRGGRGGFGGNPEDKAKKSGAIIGGQGTKVTFDD